MVRILVLAALPLIAAAAVAPAQEAAPRPAKVFVVEATEEIIQRAYPAIVLPSRETELSFRVSGQVQELPIRAALDVQEGDLIAKLDTRDFETQIQLLKSEREQSVASLEALRKGARPEEVSAQEAAVESAQAQVDVAADSLARTQQLLERGVATTAQLEEAESLARVAEAALRAEQEQLRIANIGGRPEDIAAAEAALRGLDTRIKQAQDQLADAELRAPFDGIVARRDIENFSNIQAGAPVILLQALRPAHLIFDIPGADVTLFTQLGPENIVTIAHFDAYPGQEFPTELVEFSVDADGTTQTYRGRVSVDIPERDGILPGMVANVTVSTEGGNGGQTFVPLGAIGAEADGSPFVWKVDASNSVAASPVELGDVQAGMVEVTTGVEAGDTVIAAGVSRLTPGQVIRPITQIGN